MTPVGTGANGEAEMGCGSAGEMVLGICTYNRGQKIVRTLEAIASMDRVGGRVTRLLVVDNNSTDTTGQIVDRFASECTALPIRRLVEREQGLSAARKRLFRETSEPIVAFIDDDVVPEPDWARVILRVFDNKGRAGVAGGRVELEWESGPTPEASKYRTLLAFQEMGDGRVLVGGHEAGLVGAAIVFRRRALLESGWLDHWVLRGRTAESLTSGEDTEICIRIRQAGWELWYDGAARMKHVIPERRQSLEYLARLAEGIGRSNPQLKWLANGKPGEEWVRRQWRRVWWRRMRSILLEWRPGRRRMRLAERSGRLAGWAELLERVRGGGVDRSRAPD